MAFYSLFFLFSIYSFGNYFAEIRNNTYNCDIFISIDKENIGTNSQAVLPLYLWENDSLIANIEIRQGKGQYSYKGTWKYLYIKHNNNKVQFLVDTTVIRIEKNKNLKMPPIVIGGLINTAWRNSLDSAKERFIPLMRMNALDSLTDYEEKKLESDKRIFVSWHLNSIERINDEGLLSLVLLNNHIHYLKVLFPNIDSSLIKNVLEIKNHISIGYSKTDSYLRLEQSLNQILYLRKGNNIYDFSFVNEFGNTVSTSDYRGKFLLVDFWATWCGPCKKKNEIYKQKFQNWHNKNLEILGVLVFSDKNTWVDIIKSYKYNWTNVFCDDKITINTYSVQAIPKCILFSPEGKIIALNPTYDEVDKLLSY